MKPVSVGTSIITATLGSYDNAPYVTFTVTVDPDPDARTITIDLIANGTVVADSAMATQ